VSQAEESRQTFGTRVGMLATMIGVAVGLGNIWRFPYMVGKFGGASFVLIYVLAVLLLGVPVLMAEWALGRRTRRGPVGAFIEVGFPGGRAIGWFFFLVVTAATAYYTNAVGWVLFYAVNQLIAAAGLGGDAAAILPPESGFDGRSFGLQLVCTAVVVVACALVLQRGLRSGIERASRWIMPLLFAVLAVLIVRGLTLPGAFEGLSWYILKFDLSEMSGGVVLAALGQAFFSLSLGGTFMVVYGSYLDRETPLASNAFLTALGDLMAGLLAGLAIIPAVFAFGLAPESGPGLTFFTLPQVFEQLPLGWLFGFLFFAALLAAAWLSDVGAFEVLVAGLTDGTGMERSRAIWTLAGVVMLVSIPPMISMRVFVPWDLTFGSGMQTLGALVAVVAVGWWIKRRDLMEEFGGESGQMRWLYHWLRWVVPAIILAVGLWWVATEVLSLGSAT
jgi:NSS family neurotransmitter:Na+ symporter